MSKLRSIGEALNGLADGMTLGLGGWIFTSQPMALVREVVRRRVRDLHIVPSPGSMAPDLLIGAGCVRTVSNVFISFEQHGLAPHFRRAAEAGALEVLELDGPGLAGGLRAGACDLPWMPIPDLGTDLPKVNPRAYQPLPNEGGRKLLKVPAIKPDLVLLHGQRGDERGNIIYQGASFFDLLMAQAARRVVVSVDRLVSNAEIRRDSRLVKISSAFVHAVVEAPGGARPTASAGEYEADEAAIAAYAKAAVKPESWREWLAAQGLPA
ncbi:MAG TPA: CoA-transferase [Crenalkalicoccus sp.]|nr:CoA-transferase [Crenalkalicoccus sp.]